MSEISERRRRQTLRALITEIFMFIVIVVLVAVLALVSMGYQINFENGTERSGLVQINSIPSGANITVDGTGTFLPTNQSRTMLAGVHEISLTKNGYSSWQKTISVTEGLMYRLSYPRLYKLSRESRVIPITDDQANPSAQESKSLAATNTAPTDPSTATPVVRQAFASADRKTLYYTLNSSSSTPSDTKSHPDKSPAPDFTFYALGLNDSEPRPRSLPFYNLGAASYNGSFDFLEWSEDSSRAIVRINHETSLEWLLLNFSRPESSHNLTRDFGISFSQLHFENNDKLLALSSGLLREISLSNYSISAPLLSELQAFTNLQSRILYLGQTTLTAAELAAFSSDSSADLAALSSAAPTDPDSDNSDSTASENPATNNTTDDAPGDATPTLALLAYTLGEDAPVLIRPLPDTSDPSGIHLALSEYYGDYYLAYTLGPSLQVYSGDFPGYGDNFAAKMRLTSEKNLDFTPASLTRHGEGGLIIANTNNNNAIFDPEDFNISSFTTEGRSGWLSDYDSYLLTPNGDTNSAALTVRDFDATNPFVISESVHPSLPAVISENDRYIYFFTPTGELIQESIR